MKNKKKIQSKFREFVKETGPLPTGVMAVTKAPNKTNKPFKTCETSSVKVVREKEIINLIVPDNKAAMLVGYSSGYYDVVCIDIADFWSSITTEQGLINLLKAAPQVATAWWYNDEKMFPDDMVRDDAYTGKMVSCISLRDSGKYHYEIWHPWYDAMGPEKHGFCKTIALAKRACDKQLKLMGWRLS